MVDILIITLSLWPTSLCFINGAAGRTSKVCSAGLPIPLLRLLIGVKLLFLVGAQVTDLHQK